MVRAEEYVGKKFYMRSINRGIFDVWVLRQGNRILDSFDTLAEAQQTYPFAEVYAHD